MIPVNRHRLWQLLADGALIALAWWLAFWLRFDRGFAAPYHRLMVETIGVVIAIKLVVFVLSGFYNRWWRYVSTRDMWGAARGVTLACILADLVVRDRDEAPVAEPEEVLGRIEAEGRGDTCARDVLRAERLRRVLDQRDAE